MKRIASIFYYFKRAKKRHGTHSPFVYTLADECLSIKVGYDDLKIIKAHRNMLKCSTETIQISDFGAGSKKLGDKRKVRDVYKYSKSGNRYGTLLYKLSHYYKPSKILELGTSLGSGTLMMYLGNPQAEIDTIEGCPNTHQYTVTHFPVKSEKLNFINDTFDNFIAHNLVKKYDMIFIDGNHRGSALIEYVHKLLPHSHNDTIWVLDDIRWTEDMWQAWEKIIANENFHVTIDLFRMGILVQRKEQFKEQFWLRV